ncbi:MAG: tripartite tricarboxylate transporter permease [Nanoarchaeota archaeon]|nr:tripartite tricarboxylate transporter permease [Nanoarchaeota archaeon]
MLIEIFLAILIGIIFGTIAGLLPGIHPNLVAIFLLSSSLFLLQYFDPLILSLFIVAVTITNTFIDACPSIFLGAPEGGMELSVLPGHRLLLQGRGYEAVLLTVIGSLLAVLILTFLTPLLIPSVKFGYPIIKNYIPHILITASILLIFKERKSKIWALIIYFLSGILGLGTLNLPLSQPLFPLLSGLFGTSTLTLSIIQKSKLPKQKITQPKVNKKEISKSLSAGFLASTMTGLLPGLGASQAAIISSSLLKKISTESFLVLMGSINTFVMIISFIALYVINKARNGSIVVVSQILQTFNLNYLILFLGTTLLVAGIATFLTLKLAKIFSNILSKVNYTRLCLIIIILITVLVTILTGPLGLFVLIISTALGIVPTLKGIGKNHLMGCLLFPIILFFVL